MRGILSAMLDAGLIYIETLIRTRRHRAATIDFARSRWMSHRINANARLRWSRATGKCWRCRYPIRTDAATCPECGEAVSSAASNQSTSDAQ